MSFYGLVGVVALGGVASALQAQFMGILDKRIGTLESVFITYFGGGLLMGVIMLIQRGGHLGSGATVPWYAYTSGILGLVIVGALGYSAPRLGLAAAFAVFLAAQFLMGALVDHFGWMGAEVRPLNLARLAGMGLLLGGTWLITRN